MKNLLTLISIVAIGACSSSVVKHESALGSIPLQSCEAIQTFVLKDLDSYQDRIDKIARDYQIEQWKVEAADPKASSEKMSELFAQQQKVVYDQEILKNALAVFEASKNLSEQDCPLKTKMPRIKQLLETTILMNDAVVKKEKENQDKQDALISKSNAYRIQLPDEKEPVSKAIYAKKMGAIKDRSQREKLYKAYNSGRSQKWTEWNFKELVKSRNEEGRLAGFKNYYEYRFFRSQLNLENYLNLVKEIKTKLAPRAAAALKQLAKKEGLSKVEGWDMRFLREKSASGEINEYLKEIPETAALEIARKFYRELGIEIDSYHFQMDLYPRSGKNTHAFAMGVMLPRVDAKANLIAEPKMDIRFLANLKKPVVWSDVSTVIHELGHAIHFGEVRQPIAALRGIGSVETEAIAMTTERMAGSEEFLRTILPEYVKATPKELAQVLKKHVEAQKLEQAFVLLRQAYFSDFEHEVYLNPDQDLAKLWSKMHQEWWGVDIAPEYVDWDVDHFVMAPIYVQNYAIGLIMVQQFYQSIQKEFKTSYRSKPLGDKLKKIYFAPGIEWDYLELTRKFTGKPLTAEAALGLLPK